MKRLFGIAVVLFATAAFGADAPDLTGNWTVHTSIAGNENDQPCKFVQSGSKLTGTCKGQAGDVEIVGAIDGNKVSWKYNSEYQGTPLTVRFAATLDGSEKIRGTVDVDPFNASGEFTATQSKADKK